MSGAFTELPDLASQLVGGAVMAANDEFFASRENLIKPGDPVWIADKYTDRGKWMDGWETRRRRSPGHDWCLLRLGLPGLVRGVVVNTRYFRGNYPDSCRLEATCMPPSASVNCLLDEATPWEEILPQSKLVGDAPNLFPLDTHHTCTHLRLHIYPDGGVARLRVHGEPAPDWRRLAQHPGELDLACIDLGARVLGSSDDFFGSHHHLILASRARGMHEGWETRRRRGPGHDWAVVRLAAPALLHKAMVDTSYFKGNYPGECSLEACYQPEAADIPQGDWWELLPRSPLHPHTLHLFVEELQLLDQPITHVRLRIYPDGGVSRLRLYGTLSEEGWSSVGLRRLNRLMPHLARQELADCCGSTAWAGHMAEALPCESLEGALDASKRAFDRLTEEEWLEAFKSHPRIGGKKSSQAARASSWSAEEQAGTADADQAVNARLAALNEAYFERFGFIYIVCATGKSAEEMLQLLETRLENDRETEIQTAATEQRKITRLRLHKLVCFRSEAVAGG